MAAATSWDPGSEMPGMPASLTTATVFPLSIQPTTCAMRCTSLCACRETSRPGAVLRPQALSKRASTTGVLTTDQISLVQCPGGTRREVAQIANRGGDQDQDSGHCVRHATKRISSVSPTARPQRSKEPASASRTLLTLPRGKHMRQGSSLRVLHHSEIGIELGHIDRHSHHEGVHRTDSGEVHGTVVGPLAQEPFASFSPEIRLFQRRTAPRHRAAPRPLSSVNSTHVGDRLDHATEPIVRAE